DSQYWVKLEDPRTQLRFAVPCFWSTDFPLAEIDPTGLGSESFENFTEQFVTSLGPKRGEVVWALGGMKFDLGYH
ncbi:MAG: hypothetical protein GWN58_00235, partial [Anaerolineae bacterium]|nr:hypothetical protein [Anaerolineae bacterium]